MSLYQSNKGLKFQNTLGHCEIIYDLAYNFFFFFWKASIDKKFIASLYII